MKKYIAPNIEVIEIELQQMIASSVTPDNDNVEIRPGEAPEGDAEAKQNQGFDLWD